MGDASRYAGVLRGRGPTGLLSGALHNPYPAPIQPRLGLFLISGIWYPGI